jgi:hypothetical protein
MQLLLQHQMIGPVRSVLLFLWQYFVEKCSVYRMIFTVARFYRRFLQFDNFNHLWLYTKAFITLGGKPAVLILGR